MLGAVFAYVCSAASTVVFVEKGFTLPGSLAVFNGLKILVTGLGYFYGIYQNECQALT